MTTTERTQAQGAMRGVQVLDFGQYIPGPMLGMLLSDQGADVIKVERPGGDPARSEPAFATWNRGKRSVVLDLTTPEGQAAAVALAKKADIVIENYRPGVADRLGIGYEALAKANPGLLYCSIPGFGEDSPHRNERGWEGIVAASTGVYQPIDGSGEPLFLPLPAASTFAALVAAVSVTMAMVARDRTGKGQRIEVPMHSAMFSAIGRHLVKLYDVNPPDLFNLPRNVMSHQYMCADGRYFQSHGMYQRFVSQLMDAAGRPEWIEELQDLYGTEVAPETVAMWKDRFEKMYLERPAKEWEDAIAASKGVGTICKTIDEWLVHEHAIAGKIVAEVDDAEHGNMKQPGVQVRLRGTPGAIQGRAPKLGEHTDEILAELGNSSAPAATPKNRSENIMSALEGLRVLDLCIVLAGPTCGRTLGEFGADVIKIDDPARPYDVAGNADVNRGKRSIQINLKTKEGLSVFYKLLENADVVVENNRKSSLARLGISYEEMSKRKPDIVHASLNAFGYDGPWSERPGWEQLAQATSGIQVRRGGRDAAPKLLPYPMNDYGTGLMGAYAVALAVHERNRTGKGQQVDSGLALTAALLQSPYFLDYDGYKRDEPEGLGVRGFSAKSRLYAAADGWLYLHCPDDEAWGRLTGLPEFTGMDAGSDESLTRSMAQVLAGKPRSEWAKVINPTGVSVIANRMVEDFRDDADIRKAGLIVKRYHPGYGQADHLGSVAKLSETPMRIGRPTPLLGAETDDILSEAGYTGEQIESMKLSGAVVQHPV
ncbi:MAG: CoA transferase [Chloroflexi bacterium]|nr:CoA transferase [Chloroflexota bacterium]MDA1269920.1 CoA transferase [Chloroflexota bacterium]